jgi:hypothetical protein
LSVNFENRRERLETFHEYLNEYREQLERGVIQKAENWLMGYILNLRTYLKNKYLRLGFGLGANVFTGCSGHGYDLFLPFIEQITGETVVLKLNTGAYRRGIHRARIWMRFNRIAGVAAIQYAGCNAEVGLVCD